MLTRSSGVLTALCGTILVTATLLSPLSAASDTHDEEQAGGYLDASVKNGNGQTTIHGRMQSGGSSGGAHSSPRSRSGSSNQQVVDAKPRPQPPTPEECRINWDAMISCWEHVESPEGARDEEIPGSTPSIPPITITDLASFSPAKGTVLGEPDNLGVAGLPTNFVTQAETHVRSGQLFGFPIDVRFTPVSYTFHYGDGESRTAPSPGASWESLGQAQFTPTDTSHTYAERGTYDATVDIAYTAEIDLGVGWFPIEGQLDIPGPTQQIRIFEAHTSLVARTCTEQPSAPGC